MLHRRRLVVKGELGKRSTVISYRFRSLSKNPCVYWRFQRPSHLWSVATHPRGGECPPTPCGALQRAFQSMTRSLKNIQHRPTTIDGASRVSIAWSGRPCTVLRAPISANEFVGVWATRLLLEECQQVRVREARPTHDANRIPHTVYINNHNISVHRGGPCNILGHTMTMPHKKHRESTHPRHNQL